jgi:hypothetical protein
LATGIVIIHLKAAVEDITDRGEDGVVVTARDPATNLVSTYTVSYLVSADDNKFKPANSSTSLSRPQPAERLSG